MIMLTIALRHALSELERRVRVCEHPDCSVVLLSQANNRFCRAHRRDTRR